MTWPRIHCCDDTCELDHPRMPLRDVLRRIFNPNVRPDDPLGMDQDKRIDTANEPVDQTDDSEFMDTGVLHDADDKAARREVAEGKNPYCAWGDHGKMPFHETSEHEAAQ